MPSIPSRHRLCVEALEDRRLLSVNHLPGRDTALLQIDPDSYDPSSVIVRFRVEQDFANVYGPTQILDNAPLGFGLHKIGLKNGVSIESVLASYRDNANVLYAEPDYRVRIATIPNDPQFSDQWDMHNTGQVGGTFDADIDAPEAWDVIYRDRFDDRRRD